MVTTAMGVGQERFSGMYDNTDIFGKLRAVMGLREEALEQEGSL